MGRAAQVRSEAFWCLAMVHFICGTYCLEEGGESVAAMELCKRVASENYQGEAVAPSLRATALDCWSLMTTTLHNTHVAVGYGNGDDLGRGLCLLPLLVQCLDGPDTGLRC